MMSTCAKFHPIQSRNVEVVCVSNFFPSAKEMMTVDGKYFEEELYEMETLLPLVHPGSNLPGGSKLFFGSLASPNSD